MVPGKSLSEPLRPPRAQSLKIPLTTSTFAFDIGLEYPAAARRITSPTMADAIRVLVSGAAGRMGETVCDAVDGADDMELAGRADPALDSSVSGLLDGADVMVDFSTPEAAPANVMEAVNAGVHAVVGSTGFDIEDLRASVWDADDGANCFLAPNFAIGAVLMMEASKLIAPHMPEAEIIELHHDQKKDAPSGTAKRTAELIGAAGGNVHEPIHSVRLPGLVAHQEVVFGGEGQTLTIRHDSTDRTSFMPGVLLAVRKVPDLPERFVVGLENLL
ncbi:MAG TPA: dihydrodipicolinate reductase C-terminal domain-containing protein [Solirubrobacterales bacterium]